MPYMSTLEMNRDKALYKSMLTLTNLHICSKTACYYYLATSHAMH